MAFKSHTEASADRDTEGIIAYLAETLNAPRAASHFKESLRACYTRLTDNPLIYPLCRDEVLAAKGIRLAPVMRYIVFYTVDEGKQIVQIHRILHGSMDYVRQEMN